MEDQGKDGAKKMQQLTQSPETGAVGRKRSRKQAAWVGGCWGRNPESRQGPGRVCIPFSLQRGTFKKGNNRV